MFAEADAIARTLPQTETSDLAPATVAALGTSELVDFERIGRPTPPESESRAANVELDGFGFRSQVSFIDGQEVRYGAEGSTRPDEYSATHRLSVDVKNLDASNPKNVEKFIQKTVEQAVGRQPHLPGGTRQSILIDLRGQDVPADVMQELRDALAEESGGLITPDNVEFITDEE